MWWQLSRCQSSLCRTLLKNWNQQKALQAFQSRGSTKNSVGLKPLIEFAQFFRRHSMMRDLIGHVCLPPNQNSQTSRPMCPQLRDEWSRRADQSSEKTKVKSLIF